MTHVMMHFTPILLPVFVLVGWTLMMLAWMAAVRLPYIASQVGRSPEWGEDVGQRTADLGAQMPKEIQWKADNYNHLLEQPTAFYAVAIGSAMVGLGVGLNLYLAWAYVILRIIHSLVHATINRVPLRFGIFLLSTLCLLVMTVNALMQWIN